MFHCDSGVHADERVSVFWIERRNSPERKLVERNELFSA